MSGWLFTCLCIVSLVVVAVAIERRVATRWYGHLIVALLALLLVRPALSVTGDISAILPDLWSTDVDGKDQIILVSVAATLTVPVIAASVLAYIGKETIAMWSELR